MSEQPQLEWAEIREHLVRRLMLDREWTLQDEDALIWQPWLLPVHLQVSYRGEYNDGFPFLVVKAWIRVAAVDEEPGMRLAAAGNDTCPMATFFYDEEGMVLASCGVSLNADGGTNLVLLHNAVLAMATAAHELLAGALEEGGLIPGLTDDEEPLGRREVPDELLGIFGAGGASLPGQDEFVGAWVEARPLVADRMAAMGFEPGYTDESVDYYNMAGAWVGFGLGDESVGYGPGLDVLAFASPQMAADALPSTFVNEANSVLGGSVSNIGNIIWIDQDNGGGALQLRSYLPWAYLGEYRDDPENLATAVFNALTQIAQGARTVARAATPEVA